MGHVTFGAFAAVMVPDDDLFEPLGPGGIGFVATDAMAAGQLDGQDIGIFRVFAAYAVAGFAGERLVFKPGEFLQFVGMTFIARLLARVNRRARTQFHQRFTPIPAKFSE
jgi:hypothetical protein